MDKKLFTEAKKELRRVMTKEILELEDYSTLIFKEVNIRRIKKRLNCFLGLLRSESLKSVSYDGVEYELDFDVSSVDIHKYVRNDIKTFRLTISPHSVYLWIQLKDNDSLLIHDEITTFGIVELENEFKFLGF